MHVSQSQYGHRSHTCWDKDLMKTPVYLPFEVIANRLIQYMRKMDPECFKPLTPYHGKTLVLTLSPLSTPINIQIHEQSLEVTLGEQESIVPDAQIEGELFELFALFRASHPNSGQLHQRQVTLKGDIELINAFSQSFKHFDFDLGEQLAPYLGDPLAHQVALGFKKLSAIPKEFVSRRGLDLKEFLQEEISVIVSHNAIEDFYHDIALLREDVDRASARLAFLQKHLGH